MIFPTLYIGLITHSSVNIMSNPIDIDRAIARRHRREREIARRCPESAVLCASEDIEIKISFLNMAKKDLSGEKLRLESLIDAFNSAKTSGPGTWTSMSFLVDDAKASVEDMEILLTDRTFDLYRSIGVLVAATVRFKAVKVALMR